MKQIVVISIGLVFLLASTSLFSQDITPRISEIKDSLAARHHGKQTENLINSALEQNATDDSKKLLIVLLKGKLFDQRFDYDAVLETAKPYLYKIKSDSILGEYSLLIGRAYRFTNQSDSSFKYFEQARILFERIKAGAPLIEVHTNLGGVYFGRLQEDRAFKEYKTAIELMALYNDSSKYVPLMSNAAACLLRLGDYQTAKVYYKKLLRKYIEQESFIGQVYANLGVVYSNQDSAAKAEESFLKAIPLLQSKETRTFLGIVYFNLIDINLNKGELSEALHYAKLSEPIITQTQPNRLGYLYEGYANIYKELGKDELALNFYNRAINYAVDYEQWGEASSAANNLSLFYQEKNMLEKALEFARKTTEYRNNFMEQTKVEAIEKYRIAFESDQKEFEIAQLEALNDANRQRIEAQQKVQNLIIGIGIGVLLVGIIITFLVMRFRLQKATLSNKATLAELNNKLVLNRLSPHFIFNVLNSIQYYINSKDRKNANYYLARFADLLRKFLESFSEDYHQLSEELALIEEYIALEQMLKNDSFQFSINVDDDVNQQSKFPTMLLQPLIENAIKHGTTDKNPYVRVGIQKKESTIVCIVEDNGTGIIERESKHRSRGIELSKKRISLLNQATKSKYSLIWENKNGEETGLRITLKIPF